MVAFITVLFGPWNFILCGHQESHDRNFLKNKNPVNK